MDDWIKELENLDEVYLVNTLTALLKVPTAVPVGPRTLMEPDDPLLVHYVREVIRPELQRLKAYEIIDAPLNQLIVRLGDRKSDKSLLVMAYTPTQHSNLMVDPYSGKIGIPLNSQFDEPCAFGQGASQNKAHMAAMLAVIKLLIDRRMKISGALFFAVNNEGRSSHACTEALLPLLFPKPQAGIIAIGTNMGISIGNRGRIDIYVHVKGKATHSSDPESGLSAIEGAHQVMKRLEAMKLSSTHPILGGQRAIVYQIVYDPIAPHTLPGNAKLTVDRRLIPGDDPDEAVEEVRGALTNMAPYEMRVERGVCMLPSLTPADSPVVLALKEASRQVRGKESETYYGRGTFDAGGLTSAGIPAVMFGASGGSKDILGEDYVCIREVVEEAKMLAYTILKMLS